MEVPAEMDLGQWFADLGPLLDAVEIREYGDDTWVLVLDADFGIVVDLDAARDCLVFSAILGQPSPGSEAQAYKVLLQVAMLWRETGGLRMGLDAADDKVVQLLELPLAGLEPEKLLSCLRNFAAIARKARAALPQLGAGMASHVPPAFLRA